MSSTYANFCLSMCTPFQRASTDVVRILLSFIHKPAMHIYCRIIRVVFFFVVVFSPPHTHTHTHTHSSIPVSFCKKLSTLFVSSPIVSSSFFFYRSLSLYISILVRANTSIPNYFLFLLVSVSVSVSSSSCWRAPLPLSLSLSLFPRFLEKTEVPCASFET